MPQFSVGSGGGAGGGAGGPLLASVSDFVLLPRLPEPEKKGTVENIVITEVGDQLAGRAGNSGSETKGIQKAIEKGLRFGKLREAFLDVLFGDNKVGAPDPVGRQVVKFVDENGQEYTLDANMQPVKVQMLPMWEADP